MYSKGQGVDKSNEESIKWYKKAAEAGFAMSQYDLGSCYYYGIGVAEDKKEGLKWWRLAAEQEYEPAVKALEDAD